MARRKYSRKIRRFKRNGYNSSVGRRISSVMKSNVFRLVLLVIIVVAIVLGLQFYNRYSTYDDYSVTQSIDIDSGEESKYVQFGDFVVKYSTDGISYIDGEETVWDEAYEMKTPIVDVCDGYLAICDKNTNDIYLYDEDGRYGTITTECPIVKLEVAKQGVVAALLKDTDANYIEVYDKEGDLLVSHKTLIEENGYPVDFSLSEDGTKMVVSCLSVNSGTISNQVYFYNFSSAGKNSENRMVGSFDQYGETIVPTVEFVSNNCAITIGEDVISIYKMKNTPGLDEEVTFEDEAYKVFYDEDYIGLVFEEEDGADPYRLVVYNMSGSQVMETNIDMDYDTFKFAGDNVLMYSDLNCRIISLKGVEKFNHTFEKEIRSIIPLESSETYLLMTDSKIEKVRLK